MFPRRSTAIAEQRVFEYIENQATLSETPVSLARKLDLDVRTARRVLDHLFERGRLHRREFGDIESIYYRYPSLDGR